MVIGVVSAFFAWMWSLAGTPLRMLVTDNLEEVFMKPLVHFFLFVSSPVIVAVMLFIETALVHFVLMILGGNRLGFEATFRVMAYTEATSILMLVPVCGSGVGIIWGLVASIIGLYSIHDTGPWRAVIAVILPSILCLGTLGSFRHRGPAEFALSRAIVVMAGTRPRPVTVST